MSLIDDKFSYSVMEIPISLWEDFFGEPFPSKQRCLGAKLRPFRRADGKVYAFFCAIDFSEDKKAWKYIRGREGGPNILDLLANGAQVFGGASWWERYRYLSPEMKVKVLKAKIYRHKDSSKSLLDEVDEKIHNKDRKSNHKKVLKPREKHSSEAITEAQAVVEQGDADVCWVYMDSIGDGDIVETLDLYPNSFAGEKKNKERTPEQRKNRLATLRERHARS